MEVRKAALAGSSYVTEGGDMLRAVQTRNLGHTNPAPSSVGGRTLVELQQARAGANNGMTGIAAKRHSFAAGIENDVACWDPENDEDMPSPFLCRTRKSMVIR